MSLLLRAKRGEEYAWKRLVDIYQPLLHNWFRQQKVHPHEVHDLTQDVLATVVTLLPKFEHAGRPGSFRAWLRAIVINRSKTYFRAGKLRTTAHGSALPDFLDQFADEANPLTRAWDEEHNRHVIHSLLARLEGEFSSTTLRAFRRLMFEQVPPKVVAEELGLTLGSVYSAKSGVLHRLRELASDLLD